MFLLDSGAETLPLRNAVSHMWNILYIKNSLTCYMLNKHICYHKLVFIKAAYIKQSLVAHHLSVS